MFTVDFLDFQESLSLGELGLLFQPPLPDRSVHAEHLAVGEGGGNRLDEPTHNGVEPERVHDDVGVADPAHGHVGELVRGGDGECGAHLGELGGNVERNLAAHGDVVLGALASEAAGEHGDVALGSAVLGKEGHGVAPGSRGDVDDRAALALHHAGEDHVCHPGGGVDVHLHQTGDLILLQLGEVLGELVAHADVVDEHADVEVLHGLLHLGPQLGAEIRVVAHHDLDLDTRVFLLDLLLDGVELGLRPANKHHVQALLRQLECVGLADAVCGTSHDSPFAEFLQVLGGAEEILVKVRQHLQGERRQGESSEDNNRLVDFRAIDQSHYAIHIIRILIFNQARP
mmetsp:Transcript_21713/g.40876  ORF Transcript_21713/g.40876 Transcript_21713/m.40876 type:complete len:343 (+) Transcript_21713:63-1091(+)